MRRPLLELPLELDLAEAAGRLAGIIRETPLVRFPASERRVDLCLKLECLQETGSFKARGAWNNVAALTPAERAAGVVTVSSGNHGQALAWAARRAGVRAAIAMPRDAYPNKIQACRDLGAEVLLGESREDAERLAREREAAGAVLIHPYDRDGTIQGAGTVGREILEQWPEVELILVPVGGGGLLAGCCLAARGAAAVIGVEPEGAPTMTRALAAGAPVAVASTSAVQGLCPPAAGRRNAAIAAALAERVLTLGDLAIFAAQRRLVREGGWVVEPAGAAGAALVLSGRLPEELLAGRSPEDPLRVVAVVSGGNPDPAQLRRVTEDP